MNFSGLLCLARSNAAGKTPRTGRNRQEAGGWTQGPPGREEKPTTMSDKKPELPRLFLMGAGGQGRTKRPLQNKGSRKERRGGAEM